LDYERSIFSSNPFKKFEPSDSFQPGWSIQKVSTNPSPTSICILQEYLSRKFTCIIPYMLLY
jgi:hypothetical protein